MPAATGNMTKYRMERNGTESLQLGAGSWWEIGVPAWPKGRMSVKKCSLRCPDGLELHCWGFRVVVWVLTRHFKQMVMNALSLNPRDGPEHWHILCNTHHNGQKRGKGTERDEFSIVLWLFDKLFRSRTIFQLIVKRFALRLS